MTTTSAPAPQSASGSQHQLTAHDVLFADVSHDEAAAAVASALGHAGYAPAVSSAGRLTEAARRAVGHEVGAAADSLLDLDLGDAVVAGWRKYSVLMDAARRTRGSSGREVVELASHRVTTSARPHVDLYVDDVRVNRFEFTLDLVLDIVGCSATVVAGDLVAVGGGDVTVRCTLGLEGATLLTRSRTFPSHAVVQLRHARPLLPPEPLG